MAYDLAPLTSYVRFYLTVVTQLGAAWENLGRTHDAVKTALQPFAEPLGPVDATALTSAIGDGPTARAIFAELWAPEDAAELSGLTDVYEVVGRFSFQGEDNKNLGRVQALVSGARNEIVAQRNRLTDLQQLPNQARAAAARLSSEEGARAEAERKEKMAAFEPLAEQVNMRARQTIDAVRAVPKPNLDNAETAAEEYKRYVIKIEQVYQTCLPFLVRAIQALYTSVGYEPGASWPETLPLERELPPELCGVPPADSPELSHARSSLHGLGDEEIQLGRARDDVASAIARIEGETAAAMVKLNELDLEIGTATSILELATLAEQIEGERQRLAALEQQRAQRMESAGRVWQRQTTIEAGIKVLEDELKARTVEIGQAQEQLDATTKDEPVLFGKDEWRARVAAADERVNGLRLAYGQRFNTLNQLKIDLSSVSVELQTEQQQSALIDRQITEARSKIEALSQARRELAGKLGPSMPARQVTPDEAREAIGMYQQARAETVARIERLKTELRRQKEETVRVLTRLKQIGFERQQVGAMLESANVAATRGREEALRQLAIQRRAAVDRHLVEVLGTLEKSLGQVAVTFIEPAREILLKATAPKPELAAAVLDAAEKVAPVVAQLARELDPDLLAQDTTLEQIQREFCDVAAQACKAAWG